MTKFYDLLLNQVKELGDTIEKIKSSNSMHQISEYEVRVRKLCENIIISASMVPNKDIYSLSMQKRRGIQESVLSPVERVREILSQPEKPAEEIHVEEEPKAKRPRKNKSAKSSKKAKK